MRYDRGVGPDGSFTGAHDGLRVDCAGRYAMPGLVDAHEAAKHCSRFVALWSEADPELLLRVRTAQAHLDRIVSERG